MSTSVTAQVSDAVQYASKHGWTISHTRFVPESKELCVISAIYLNSMQYDLSTYSPEQYDKILAALIQNEQKRPNKLQTLKTFISVLVACEKVLQSQDFAVPDNEDWRESNTIARELKEAGLLHLITPHETVRLWSQASEGGNDVATSIM